MAAHSVIRICVVASFVFIVVSSCCKDREKCVTHFCHFTHNYLELSSWMEVDELFTIYFFSKTTHLKAFFIPDVICRRYAFPFHRNPLLQQKPQLPPRLPFIILPALQPWGSSSVNQFLTLTCTMDFSTFLCLKESFPFTENSLRIKSLTIHN